MPKFTKVEKVNRIKEINASQLKPSEKILALKKFLDENPGEAEVNEETQERLPEPIQKIEIVGAESIAIKGDRGEKGDSIVGPEGPVGPQGEIGPMGPEGKQGESIKGEQGPEGPKGKDGIDGKDGKDAIPAEPVEVRKKLELLKGSERLHVKHIHGLDNFMADTANAIKADAPTWQSVGRVIGGGNFKAGSGISIASDGTISASSSSGGSGTVTSVSVTTANGVSGSVTNPTTTPAISLTLGAITPTSVNSVVVSGSSTPTLAVTGTTTVSGSNTGDQTNITGNAATVTTNANLTGPVTSSGNATSIANSIALPASPTTTTQSAGDNSTKIATTAFVQNAITSATSAIPVNYATTAAGDTSGLTYNNGASGIGATLTGANNTAVTIDGHAFVVGDVNVARLLVKNDTQSPSGAFNGVYLFTALQTAGTGAIFTRATDYNTATEMNDTGAIPVISGTANALTSWIMTANITVVGTTPLTFSQFTYAQPYSPTIGGTGVSNNAAMTVTGSGNYAYTRTLTASTNVTFPTTGTLSTLAGTETLTNHFVTPQVQSVADAGGTFTPVSLTNDIGIMTALSQATTIAAPTGSPVQGEKLTLRIKDNGTARALTWNSIYRASSDLALPTTTIISKTMYCGFIYNTTDTKWDMVAFINNF